MKFEALKVGELAMRTGLTVRTLHHYDEIGLLKPSMTMIEKYYTPQQIAQFDARAKEVGQEAIDQAPQQWSDLFTAVTGEMEAGTDPADPKAQELAKRWLALVTLCTGGDPGIFNSLRRMYENEDNVMGTDTKALRPKMEYILKAAAAAGIKHPGQ